MTLHATLEATRTCYNDATREGDKYSFSTLDSLLDAIYNQRTIHKALKIVREINDLNENIITEYQIAQIKQHYERKEKKAKMKYRQLQKGYMEMLSAQVSS